MQRFLVKIAFFFLLLCSVIIVYKNMATGVLEHYQGPNTEKQISYSFENALKNDYDVFIMGNSRIYRGVNPEKFSVNTFNFAHDHESFNQIYHKLVWLKSNNISLKTVVLGIDYFQFSIFSDSRNYAYYKYLDKDYLSDYPYRFLPIQPYENIRGNAMTAFIADYTSRYLSDVPNTPLQLKENGQLVVDGISKSEYLVFKKRSSYLHPIQMRYLKQILSFTKKNNIELVLLIPPTRSEELSSYTDKFRSDFDYFFSKIALDDHVSFLNFSTDSIYNYTLFSDITHLNLAGSNQFSNALNDSLLRLKVIRP